MDKLPEEIILHIISFLPVSFVFTSVSLVSKQFRRLAYDRVLVKFASNMIQEVDIDKDSFSPEALWKFLNVICVARSNCVKSLAIRNGSGTWDILQLLQTKLKEVRILNLSGTKGTVPAENVISNAVFAQLREVNVSGTRVDDYFLQQLGERCRLLYCVNISRCLNISHAGIFKASFNLAVMNMSYCRLGVESVIHAVREYGCTVTCIKGINVTLAFADAIHTLFPDVIEIGVPVICGFSFRGHTCPNVCYWCSENDVTKNLLSLETSLHPYAM